MKKIFLFTIATLAINFSFAAEIGMIKPSDSSAVSELIEQGNKLLGKGEFSAARVVWEEVLRQDADDANVNFKVGMCYYNSLDASPEALPYLKKACKHISEKYDFFSATEKNAPYDALYFLGATYLASDLPDSALLAFFQYEDKFNGNPPIPVERQIRYCINAKNSKKNPRDVTMKNPGGNVNTTFSETNPVLTIDNSVLFFASRRAEKDANKKTSDVNGKYDMDIYYTHKDASGRWETATPFKWNTDKDEAPLYISSDGLTLYFCKDVKGQFDIFSSSFVDKVWSEPKPVAEINSSANETGLSISADGKYLYFSSDRAGGVGKYDIYQCVKNGDKWSSPKNISSLNTSYSEISPYINPNGRTLFFASNGYRDGLGGYDIFFSEQKDDGTWSTPQNMGFPVNTTRDDINYYITSGGNRYYSTVRDDANSFDIFKIEGGGFPVENIESGGVVTLTQEMNVSDVVEVQKTVEKEVDVVQTLETTVEVVKEVEKVDVEKEKAKMDSMMTLAKKEVGLEKSQLEAAKIQARADSIKAVAAIKIAEADKAKAEADAKKSEAEKAKEDAAKAKSDAAISASEAVKAKADAMIAAAQKAKEDALAAKENAVAKKSDADKAKADAATAQAEATKVKAEADKEKATAAAAAAVTAKAAAEQKTLELKNQLVEAEKPKNEAIKAKAEADKAKAEEAKLKAQEKIAEAAKAKADAVIAAAEKAKANAEEKKSQAEIASAEKEKAAAAKADAIAKAAQANADKTKAVSDKAAAIAEKAKADAESKKADAEKLKAQAEIAAAEKAKANAEKAQALADKAKADAEAKKAQAEIIKAQQPILQPKSSNPSHKNGGAKSTPPQSK